MKIYTALLQFSFPNVTFPSTFQFLIIFGTGFEVLTVVRIHNVVWVTTLYSLVYTWLWLEEHFGSLYTGYQMMEAVGPG